MGKFKYKITKHHGYHSANQVFIPGNFAIAMSYFSVGFTTSFMSTSLNIYLVSTLNAEPPMQTTIGILQTLPWSLKLIFGFISDVCPIYGMHRKPYLSIGALMYSFALMGYALLGINNVVVLALTLFLATMGMIMMDVMADTMCVERSRFEPEDIQGQMQSSYYSIRFAGALIGSVLGALVSNKDIWGWGLTFNQVALITGCVPFVLVCPFLFSLREKYRKVPLSLSEGASSDMIELPLDERVPVYNSTATAMSVMELTKIASAPDLVYPYSYQQISGTDDAEAAILVQRCKSDLTIPVSNFFEDIDEEDTSELSPLSKQCQEIWQTVQLKSVWRPMAFVFCFNMLQIPNVAWQSYLQLTLHFEPWVLGAMVVAGSFMTFAGVVAYKYFFFKTSWRKIYLWSALLTTFFSLLQLVLIFQLNTKYFHISNYFFSLGDDVITSYINGIQFLPLCIMYMKLCPDGAEGASYSMLTTFGNIALVCASNLGNIVASFWDVSNEAMREGDTEGLWRLHVFTSVISLLPLCLLFLLPRNEEEQEELRKNATRSRKGGAVFLAVLIGSLAWSVGAAGLKLYENWSF